MCIVKEIPTGPGEPITVCFAPPGVRQMPSNTSMEQLFVSWYSVQLRPQYSPLHSIKRSQVARRWQYPLKLFVASTIHKTMGDTVPLLATQIIENTPCQDSSSSYTSHSLKYELWMREQLYVIISRVRSLDCITFVGDKITTLQNVKKTIQIRSQWSALIHEIIDGFSANPPREVQYGNTSPFPPFFYEIPDTKQPFVYLLLSTKQKQYWYVGTTINIRRRLREHNSGYGDNYTKPIARRPWHLMAYTFGFYSRAHADEFEREWRGSVNREHRDVPCAQAIIQAAIRNIQCSHSETASPINMVVCGRM